MVTIYCTSQQVADYLNITDFDGNTKPNVSIVEDFIESNEDFIDSYTGHSWRTSTKTNEYIEPKEAEAGLGIRFDLQHRSLRTFTSGTDKFEIFNGSTWYDYVANKTEGRLSDYFVDYTNGVVYLRNRTTVYPKGVRFTYRYGEEIVDKSIQKACILLTSADVLIMLDKVVNFTDDGGTNRPSHDRRVQFFREEAYRILDNLKEFKTL